MPNQNNLQILIKLGELVLKKGNRNLFLELLFQNVKKAFEGIEVKVHKFYDYLLVDFINPKELGYIWKIL